MRLQAPAPSGRSARVTAVPVMLRRAGLSDADIQTMLVDNPREALPLAFS